MVHNFFDQSHRRQHTANTLKKENDLQTEYDQRTSQQPAWTVLTIACIALGSTLAIAQSDSVRSTLYFVSKTARTVQQRATALHRELVTCSSLKTLCIDLTADCILHVISETREPVLPGFHSECQTLTCRTIEAIPQDSSGIYLPNLVHLSLPAAHHLGGCSGIVDLSGLTSVDAAVAKALAGNQKLLCLNGLTSITPDVAQILSQTGGTLQLNGLAEISPDVAAAFVKHKGTLTLNNLHTMPSKVAKFLSKHPGDISLNALRTLSDESAKAFSNFQAGLHINGVTTISKQAASLLAKHPGWRLGCHELCRTAKHKDLLVILQQHSRSGVLFSHAVNKIAL